MTNNSTHILHNMPTQRKSLLSRQSQRVGRVCKDCGHVPAELVVCPATSDGAHRTEMRNVPEIESVDGEPKIVRPN